MTVTVSVPVLSSVYWLVVAVFVLVNHLLTEWASKNLFPVIKMKKHVLSSGSMTSKLRREPGR